MIRDKVYLVDVVRMINEEPGIIIVNRPALIERMAKLPLAVDGWISVKDQLPDDGEQVLVVKQLKDGRKSIDFGYYWSQYNVYDASAGANIKKPVWVTRGNNDVICWMPIPKAPEVSE